MDTNYETRNYQKITIPAPLNPALIENANLIAEKFSTKGFSIVDFEEADLIVVIGGDGSLLHELRKHNYPDVPFIGIHAGTLGFLQEINFDEVDRLIEAIINGETYISRLPLLRYEFETIEGLSFNEVVIERASARTAQLSIAVNGTVFDKFIGDGLIISSPQGSSAYSVAAGGALISDGVEAMQLVPINPHNTVAYRSLHAPLVLDIDATIEIRNLDPQFRPIRVLADGNDYEITSDQPITVRLSRRRAPMLRTNRYDYFDVLAKKFIK